MKKYCFLLMVLFLTIPFFANACPLCQGGQGYSQATLTSYKLITGFLATLPMVMGGGIYWWIKKRIKKFENSSFPDTTHYPASGK